MIDEKIIKNPEQKMRRSIEIKNDFFDGLDGIDVEKPEEKKEDWSLDDKVLSVYATLEDRIRKVSFQPRDPVRGNRLHRDNDVDNRSLAPLFYLKMISNRDYRSIMNLKWAVGQITSARAILKAQHLLLETTSRYIPIFPGQPIVGSILRTRDDSNMDEAWLKKVIKRGKELIKTFEGIHKLLKTDIWRVRYSKAVDPNYNQPEKSTKLHKAKLVPFVSQPLQLREGQEATG